MKIKILHGTQMRFYCKINKLMGDAKRTKLLKIKWMSEKMNPKGVSDQSYRQTMGMDASFPAFTMKTKIIHQVWKNKRDGEWIWLNILCFAMKK